ncbi:hypothetical protein NEOLEDRAFT_1094170 [Neolentinus lepideus HHB14362 ss-1]|uniref:Cytochrome c oxidase assembly protein PET191 n=1 Tax=Neolentinus lepideus HHB14362 ss-1 TaxID=1314782 RepID=A0A165RZI5_9AGAM|nr:hypothetical protein NEOLEDRAFT_1094170 [Neolentinus lepideus HHB14362 ss-1]
MSCEPLMAALKECILRSDCVVKQDRLPSECLKHHIDELPEECQSLRKATFECKRGLLDMRKRFRGNNAAVMASKIKKESGSSATDASPAST